MYSAKYCIVRFRLAVSKYQKMSWQDCKESNILIKILAILLILINSTQCNLEDLEPKLDESKCNQYSLIKH